MIVLESPKPASDLTPSPSIYDVLKDFEGYRDKAYQDQGGIWTLGVGHTKGVKAGDRCTWPEALQWLEADTHAAAHEVASGITVNITQEMFDALTLLVYNIGTFAFHHSTLRKLLNQHHYEAAAEQFPRWCHVAGRFNEGLFLRRRIEENIFRNAKKPAAYTAGS